MTEAMRLRRHAARLASALLLGMAALALGGCVFSSTITEVVHSDDESLPIDYDADPVYVNSVQADMVSSQIPALIPIDDVVNELIEGYPEFQGDLTDAEVRESREGIDEFLAEVQAARSGSRWDAGDGVERDEQIQSSGMRVAETIDRSWLDGLRPRSYQVEVSRVAVARPSTGGNSANVGDATGDGGEGGNGSSGTGEGDPNENGGGRTSGSGDAGNSGENPDDPSNVGKNPGSTFGNAGSLDDLPEGVHSVAAVGNAAVVCAALGGADGDPNLVAADASLLGGRASEVLAARSIGTAASAWSGGGTSAGQADIAKLLEIAPDAVLVSEGDETLSAADAESLQAAGTHIVYVPAMTDPERTVLCVQRIGALLQKGGDETAASLASRYASLDSEIRDAYANDGADVFTLYASRWIGDVAYVNAEMNPGVAVRGVAFAPAGYASRPLGAYLSRAGVYNTPTMKVRYSELSKRVIVWPFAGGTNDRDWQGISEVNGGMATQNNGYEYALTRIYPGSDMTYYDLGTPAFSIVLASTASVRDAIAADRDSGGVYSSANPNSSIASDNYRVYVNPHGLFSSWAEPSMESLLETAWAHKAFKAGGDDGGVCERFVRDFYSTFYGYDLGSSYAGIENGAYAD